MCRRPIRSCLMSVARSCLLEVDSRMLEEGAVDLLARGRSGGCWRAWYADAGVEEGGGGGEQRIVRPVERIRGRKKI